jgi:S-adenosylmethionine decarboxylase
VDPGHAWIVDAFGCDPALLKSAEAPGAVFAACVADLGLTPVAAPVWHAFPDPGGVTGFLLLSESHLSVHTFPESGFAAFDLYCCRSRADWPWQERLAALLGARGVVVRHLPRGRRASAAATR